MEHLDAESLALHLEAAIDLSPAGTLKALQDDDGRKRRRAVATLAHHLTSRLERFGMGGILPAGPEGSRSLFPE